MSAYYNEHDPYKAQWLRNLIKLGVIAPGDVDERDIRDVRPDELVGYAQCHFFAGIGVWSFALRLAGWSDDRPVWTGSCPCQPFSGAGRGLGFADERHLWPHWFHLVRLRRPGVIFGEQVASQDGLAWIDLVSADVENEDYAIGSPDLCLAGFGAPTIRQRLFWVAYTHGGLVGQGGAVDRGGDPRGDALAWPGLGGDGGLGLLADPYGDGFQGAGLSAQLDRGRDTLPSRGGEPSFLGDPAGAGPQGFADGGGDVRGSGGPSTERADGQSAGSMASGGAWPGSVNGFWRDADWLLGRDGLWRPVEPGAFPLAHGAPARMGRLRAYGDAISPWPAAAFVRTFLEFERAHA